jgi:hypothetical protein
MVKTRKREPGSTQWIPLKKGPHKEVELTKPSGDVVRIDEGLAEVISLMWERNFDTQFSCEGYEWNHPEDGDEHSWSADQYRGYILMPWTPRTLDLVMCLQQYFFRFSGKVPVNWTFEFCTTRHYGGMNRICMRFPKSDIPHFAEFLKTHY